MYGDHNAADPHAQQLDELRAQVQDLTHAVKSASQPDYSRGQAERIIKSGGNNAWGNYGSRSKPIEVLGANDKSFPNPFGRAGNFWKCVQQCGTDIRGNLHNQPGMKAYVEQSANWIDSYYKKTAQQYSMKAVPSGMNETLLADGGVLVPPQISQQLLMRAYDNDLLSRTTLFPMNSNSMWLPAVNETSRADGSRFGGILAYWEGEAQTGVETKPSLARIQLNLSKLFLLVRATDELIEDAVALETFINTMATQEITFRIGDALMNGDGVSKPLGFANANCPCLVSVAKETNQAAGTLVTENIVKMWSRCWIGNRPNAVWLINQDIEPQLLTLSLGVGTGGVVTYMPPGGLSGAPYATLFGRPVIPTEFNQTLGAVGDIILADLSQVVSGTRGGMQSAVSMHVYFESAENVFRFIFRLDAKPWWLKALTPKNGSATKSPFVALATR